MTQAFLLAQYTENGVYASPKNRNGNVEEPKDEDAALQVNRNIRGPIATSESL